MYFCILSVLLTWFAAGYERRDIQHLVGGPNPKLGRWSPKAKLNGRTLSSAGLEEISGFNFQRSCVSLKCVTPAGASSGDIDL
jgi:hypothetical protein